MGSEPTVGILGLGLMGAALARALAEAGHRTLAWNRTKRRPPPSGVIETTDSSELVASSDIIISMLLDYPSTQDVLDGEADVQGKVFCQMATGTPVEASRLAQDVTNRGGLYLDAGMKLGPSDFGTLRGYIVFSGSEEGFERLEPIRSQLGGKQVFFGSDVTLAKGFELATFVRNYPWFFGFFESVAIAKRIGLPLEIFIELLNEVTPVRAIDRTVPQIIRGDYSEAHHSSIAVHRAALKHTIHGLRDLGCSSFILQVIEGYMNDAVDDGDAGREIAACFRAVEKRFSATATTEWES
jgi:3-hydroxyisobutyrate dehydrogenase-like beta-hydroxyacid dehydrogenase